MIAAALNFRRAERRDSPFADLRRRRAILAVSRSSARSRRSSSRPTTRSPSTSARCSSPRAWTHPFGTDQFGRDVLSRVIAASQIDMQIAVFATIPPFLFGTLVGALRRLLRRHRGCRLRPHRRSRRHLPLPGAGDRHRRRARAGPRQHVHRRRRGRLGVLRPADARRGPGAAPATTPPPRRVMGYGAPRIILRHLLPNAITPVIVYWMTDMALAILLGSSLGYLGLGAQPPAAEWGVLIADGKNFMTQASWISILPRHRHGRRAGSASASSATGSPIFST